MLEVESDHVQEIVEQFSKINNPAAIIGTVHEVYGPDANVCLGNSFQKSRLLKIWPSQENSASFREKKKTCSFSLSMYDILLFCGSNFEKSAKRQLGSRETMRYTRY